MNSALSLGQRDAIRAKLREAGEDLDAQDSTPRALVTRLIKRHYSHVKDVLEAFP